MKGTRDKCMTTSETKLLSVKNLTFKYGNDIILKNVNFNIYKGKNIAILGRNGGGKSTLVKVILGFLKKTSGEINFFIENIDCIIYCDRFKMK